MKNITLIIFVLLSWVLSFAYDKNQFLSVDDLSPGMTGTGYSVFRGYEIEPFDVQIISVLRNWDSKRDLILVEVHGGPDNILETSHIIAGMSGSPIYIDGKLIGAIAYGWGGTKIPIAGVTPILEMLELFERKEVRKPSAKMAGESQIKKFDPEIFFRQDDSIRDAPEGLIPLDSPLTFAGWNSRTIELFKPFLKRCGFIPIIGGSGKDIPKISDLKPGSAIGVQFVAGDLELSAIGTLTYRDEERFLAFGHPAFFEGQSELPITMGYIHGIMPSMFFSFKFGSSVDVIGVMKQDRSTAISGYFGQIPSMIPVKVNIRDSSLKEISTYKFKLARHEFFTPAFLTFAIVDSFISTSSERGKSSISAKLNIDLKGKEPLILKDYLVSLNDPGKSIANFLFPIFELYGNYFEDVDISQVSVDFEVQDEINYATIERVTLDKNQYKPGEVANLTIYLRKYRDQLYTINIPVDLPENLTEGKIAFGIFDTRAYENWEAKRISSRYDLHSLDEYLRQIKERPSLNQLVLVVYQRQLGMALGDKEFSSLPISVLSAMSYIPRTGDFGVSRLYIIKKIKIDLNMQVEGSISLETSIAKAF